jgi:hypothetical protein
MAFFLGDVTYPLGEVECLAVVLEAKRSLQPRDAVVLGQRPLGDQRHELADLGLGNARRVGAAGHAALAN